MRTNQYSLFKNAILAEFCKSKGINQILRPVGDHRDCGLFEWCIQKIKRKLSTLQMDPIFDNNFSAVKTVSEDSRTTRLNIFKKLPFELHYGGKPNTEWSPFRD